MIKIESIRYRRLRESQPGGTKAGFTKMKFI